MRVVDGVSIRGRSRDRPKCPVVIRGGVLLVFQSAAGHVTGRNTTNAAFVESYERFQSAAGHVTGRNVPFNVPPGLMPMFQSAAGHVTGRNTAACPCTCTGCGFNPRPVT